MPRHGPSDSLRSAAEFESTELAPEATQSPTIALLLAGGLCALPFLLPYNQLFEAEWLGTALGIAAVLAALGGRRAPIVSLPPAARWLLAFALLLGVQAFIVHPNYPQVPALALLYVLYAALLIWLGAQLSAANGIERAATLVAVCLLIGALLNAAAAAIQVYGCPDLYEHPGLLGNVVAELPLHVGAYGNIAQPNLFANYLGLGTGALLFLWLTRRLRSGYALFAALALAWACALSGSRTALLYAGWFALLGLLAGRLQSGADGRRLRLAAYALAGAIVAAHVAVPEIDSMLALGNGAQGALDRLLPSAPINYEPRLQIWQLAWHLFAAAPLTGVGIGEFAGAAFRAGLAPSLTQYGNQVWTSPHDLPLQLLAETGVFGAFLVFAALAGWCWQIGRRYVAGAQPVLWWIIAAVGIELIHSMVEFPLWSAHFLGVTALLIGLGSQPRIASRVASRGIRLAGLASCALLVLALVPLLQDYVRLGSTRITGAATTLASKADAARDAAVLRTLTHGLLASPAEYSIILGAPLDRSRLSELVPMSERVARQYPAHAVIVRRAVFLALSGEAAHARRILAQAMYTFPKRCGETLRILGEALPADPAAIEPLLAEVKAMPIPQCR